MKIPLHFGEGIVELEIPKENLVGVFQPRKIQTDRSDADLLKKAILPNQAQLKEQAQGRSVGILLPDGTRDLPLERALFELLPLLRDAQNLLLFICTGSHDSQSPSNRRIVETVQAQVAAAGIADYEVISHDCQSATFSKAGDNCKVLHKW